MLVVLTETYCNKGNIQITQRDDFIQNGIFEILHMNSVVKVFILTVSMM